MLSQLTVTSTGLELAGTVLAKRAKDGSLAIHEDRLSALIYAAYGKHLSPQAMRYIKRAGELMAQVKDSDWDDHTPHQMNNVPILAKVKTMVALTGLNGDVEVNTKKLAKAESFMNDGIPMDALVRILEKDDGDDSGDDEGDDDESDDGNDSGDDSGDNGDDSGDDTDSDFDDKHPRWPAGSPDSTGGEFRPKDSDAATASDGGSNGSLPQGTQVADSGQIMTDANVDNSNSKTPTAVSGETNSDGQTVIQYDDGTSQIRDGGSLAWRNNNPGNLVGGDFADAHGAIGTDDNGFAIFPDEATGQAAQAALLNSSSYSQLTVDEAIARRSPSNENDTASLQASIRQITGLTGTEQISSLTPDQFSSLTSAIQRMEGWQVGTVTQGAKKQ